MIVQLFGILDFYVGILLILANLGLKGPFLVIVLGLLFIKSLAFFGGLLSALDVLGGLILLAMSFYGVMIPSLVVWLFVAWFFQKALFSFMH